MEGFAGKSANMNPKDIASWINGTYFTQTESVLRYEGVPVKYVGDGMLSFFSGINHAERAINAAREIKSQDSNGHIVVSLNSGDIYLGKIGHPEYAYKDILGGTVNTAFMLMGWISKNIKSKTGLTENVVSFFDKTDKSKTTLAGTAELLKGAEKIKVYEMV
jgi:class 3 adenylate cyclase